MVPKRVIQMEEAIRNRDFPTFARLTCSDSNQFHAVCLDTSPPIFYMNDTSHRQVFWSHGVRIFNSPVVSWILVLIPKVLNYRIISCVEKWNRSEETPQVCYRLV